MAHITPFGDTQAHGTFGKAWCFRRSRNGVIFGAKPVPKQPNTPAQQQARANFTAAQDGWLVYDPLSKPYFEARAGQLGITARNLFTAASTQGILPPATHRTAKGLPGVQIIDNQGLTSPETGIWISFWSHQAQTWRSAGTIDVVSNIWTEANWNGETADEMAFQVQSSQGLPFRFGVAVVLTDLADNQVVQKWRIPAIAPGPGGIQNGYIGVDGSFWTEEQLTHWVCTDAF